LNRLTAKVKEIVALKRLNLIKFEYHGSEIKVVILEMNVDLKKGSKAELMIKPTAVSVLKEACGFENVLKGKILEKELGKILSNVKVDTGYDIFEAVMLKECAEGLSGDVFLVFKASDVMISKVLHD